MLRRLLSILLLCVVGLLPLEASQRALLVGIGGYPSYKNNNGWQTIHGDNDVVLLTGILKKRGFSVKSLSNAKATKSNILAEVKHLAQKCAPGDTVYLHFSMHGQRVLDLNRDEEDGIDQSVIPYDAQKTYIAGAYTGDKHLLDDELNPYLNTIKSKIGSKGYLVVVFDACYSRGMEKDDMEVDEPDSIAGVRGTSDFFHIKKGAPTALSKVKTPQKKFSPGGKLLILTACDKNEQNFEKRIGGKIYGSLTFCVAVLLQNNMPINRWQEYFDRGSYAKHIDSHQHPQAKTY